MKFPHPLAQSPAKYPYHFWGGILILVLLFLTIRWAKNPSSAPLPLVERSSQLGIAATDSAPIGKKSDSLTLNSSLSLNLVASAPTAIWKKKFATPPVNSILATPDGAIWLATEAGLGLIRDDLLTMYTKAMGTFPTFPVTSLAYDGKNLWIGTFDGLFKTQDARNFQRFSESEGLADDMIWSLEWDGLILWVGTQNGFSFLTPQGRFERVDKKISNGGLADLWVGAMLKIDKWIICGNDDGLSIWDTSFPAADPTAWYTIDMFDTNLIHNWILTLTQLNGKVWAGTPLGLCRLDTPIDQVFSGVNAAFTVFSKAQGLPSDRINALHAVDDTLWAGTGSGLCNIRSGKIQTFGVNEGLLATDVRALELASNTLWVGTSNGVQAIEAQ